jgi:hypothetical protein
VGDRRLDRGATAKKVGKSTRKKAGTGRHGALAGASGIWSRTGALRRLCEEYAILSLGLTTR